MPGRTSTRSVRSSGAAPTRKSSTTTLKSARTSAYAVEIPDEGPETSLRTQISQIFSDAQNTTATQRKLQINLRKLQERCCFEPQEVKKKTSQQDEQFDEEDFNTEVTRCVVRILNVKKGEPVGDRIIRFLGLFLKHASDKGKLAVLSCWKDSADRPQTKPSFRQRTKPKELQPPKHLAAVSPRTFLPPFSNSLQQRTKLSASVRPRPWPISSTTSKPLTTKSSI
jgi:condensin complex subunit 3